MKTPFARQVPTDVVENLKWRSKVLAKAAGDPEFADAMREACSKDPVFFMNAFAFTYDPRRKPFPKLPFILYPIQETAFLNLIDHVGERDIMIEKSRDMGASWLCVSAIAHCWLFRPWQSFLFISRVEEYVDKPGNPKALYWKFDFLIDNLPKWLRPAGYSPAAHRRKMHVENPENGSVIDGESTTGRAARGDRRTAILLDEFAVVDQGEKVLSSTRDATPCRIFNSTPDGTNNAFYSMKCSNIDKLRLHWTAHPIKAAGLYTVEDGVHVAIDTEYWAKVHDPLKEMLKFDKMIIDRKVPLEGGKLRSPWYANECDRAGSAREIAQEVDIDYEGSGYQFFSKERIQDAILSFARPPIYVGTLEFDEVTCDPIRFVEDANGNLRLWCLLGADGNPVWQNRLAVGADVSAGTGASNSCLSGIDTILREKVFELASPYHRPEGFAKLAVALCKWFRGKDNGKTPFLIWESNGPGRQFGSRVIESGYSNVYYRRDDVSISGKTSDIPGWAATSES